jgi:hypothetical protein
MLDNSIYQPMDYKAACKLLFDIDLQAPRFEGMNATVQLHSWHVTSITKIIQIYNNPCTCAAILVDTTGIGKTFQLLGFLIYISKVSFE